MSERDGSGEPVAVPSAGLQPEPAETAFDKAFLASVRVFLAAVVAAILLPVVATTIKLVIFSLADPERDLSDWHLAYLIRGTIGGVVTFLVVVVAGATAMMLGIRSLRSWMIGGALLTLFVGNGYAFWAVAKNLDMLSTEHPPVLILLGLPMLFDIPLGALTGALVWAIVRPSAKGAPAISPAAG